MSILVKFEGRVLNFNDRMCGVRYSEDCDISFSEKVPVMFDGKVVGVASVSRDNEGLFCSAEIMDKFAESSDRILEIGEEHD